VFYYNDKSYYEGEWENGQKHGSGIIVNYLFFLLNY
jgi:hypothetical protein